MQLSFSPLRIIEYKPKPLRDTAHQCGIALCEDGLRYYVKGADGDTDVCATEWVCSSFAHSLHLPVPPIKVLQARGGILAFGSQALPNCIPDIEVEMLLLNGAGNMNVPEIQNVLSATYAFDQLVQNVDRHGRNFLIQRFGIQDGQEVANLHLIDFGHSNLLNGALVNASLDARSHTVTQGRIFRRVHGFAIDAADSLLSRFREGRSLIFENAMIGLPDGWMPRKSRSSFNDRIMSREFAERIDNLREGLANGAYL